MGDSGLFANHEMCHVCGCSKEQYYTLKHRVEESKQRINLMESEFLQNTLYTENELDETREELRLLQQKYNALEKSHQELHEVNQDLEERILDVAASYEKEKQALNREVLSLSQKLLDTRFEINKLEEKNTRYKKDCELAVQLLQCTPSGAYQQHKVSTLPNDLQYYVHQIMAENCTTLSSGGNSFQGSHSSSSATSPKVTNPKQPLLKSTDQNSQYGLLASRIYDTVPANVVARAMQRRDDAEKREMEKLLQITSRRRKGGSNIIMYDKGIQTIYPYLSDKKYDLLCVKCGVSMRDVTLDDDDFKAMKSEKSKKSDKPKEKEKVKEETDEGSVAADIASSQPLVNLLDLSDTTPVQKPEAKEPSTASLLLDFLDEPNIATPPMEPVKQSPGQALAELLFGGNEENKAEEDNASNATSSQGSATPGDSGVFDDVSPVTTEQSPSSQETTNTTSNDDDSSSQPEADAAMNGKEEKEEQEDTEETRDSPVKSKEDKTKPQSVELSVERKAPTKGVCKPQANKVGPQQVRKSSQRVNGNQLNQRNQQNKPLGNKPKNPMDDKQLKPGKPEAKVSPVTKTIEPPAAPKSSPKPMGVKPNKGRADNTVPKATQVKSQGQHYMQTSV